VAIDTSSTEPISIILGDTVKWTRSLLDYPASAGWGLNYEFLNTPHPYQIAAVADGDAHRVVISAQTADGYAPRPVARFYRIPADRLLTSGFDWIEP